MRQSLQSDYNLGLSKRDATVLSLLGSAVGTASGSTGTEASKLSASAILLRVNLVKPLTTADASMSLKEVSISSVKEKTCVNS